MVLDELTIPRFSGRCDRTEEGVDTHRPTNLFEALDTIGAIGRFEGPADLNTNPKYMEGFGKHAKRRSNSD